MTSVQRIREYTNLESEAETKKPLDVEIKAAEWPQRGKIEFKNLTMRYRPEFDPVLKKLSFAIEGQMKVGVAGRTGAGKSSVLQALFRIVEKDKHDGGRIEIDGVDISEIGLNLLRESIAIIPQQPFLFIGSI